MELIAQRASQAVLRYIEHTQAELVEFLQTYIRFSTVNPAMSDDASPAEIARCHDWLNRWMERSGAFDEIALLAGDPEQPNLVARQKGTGDGPALLFNGHTDVVPVTPEQQAQSDYPAWEGVTDHNRVWGRGASDMKGGNSAFLWTIHALRTSGIQLQGDLLATLVVSEETGNHAIGVDLLGPSGYAAPFAILAEGTDLQICPASVGEFYFHIRIEGKSTSLANRHLAVHPGQAPVAGVNAIDKMWKIQRALADLEQEWGMWQKHPLMAPGNMNINISRIYGGDTYSALADTCELTGSVLFNPSLRYADVVAEFTQVIDHVADDDYWLRDHRPVVTVPYFLDYKEPINVAPDHPGCRAVVAAWEQVMGHDAELGCTSFTSDGNYLFAQGQTIITCGPGAGYCGVHGPDEWIDIKQLVDACRIYALTAIEYCGVASVA